MTGKKYLALTLILAAGLAAHAQADNGKKNVEKLCGCFSVNFRYAETFSPDANYKFHNREDMNAIELALPIENTDKKVVIQHLLVINDTMVIKHWREEWVYQNQDIYEFQGNKVWNKEELSAAAVKNTWTQTVWEVNDEPRYQGYSTWVNNDNKVYWESTADAPLPRREYTTRSDYNVLKRRNRIIITNDGYMHEQDNDKILRDNKEDKLIAQEKGYNKYYKVDESECAAANKYWKENAAFWDVVRDQWSVAIAKSKVIAVKAKADEKRLDEHFTALYKDWSSHKITQDELPGKVKEIIAKFL